MATASKKKFNVLGIREIDLTGYHDEMVTHWANEQKDSPNKLFVEARLSLYDAEGNCWTNVVEVILEKQ